MSLRVSRLGRVRASPSVVGNAAVDGGETADVVDDEDVTDDEDGRGMCEGCGDDIWSCIIGLGKDRLGVGRAGAEAEMGKLRLVSISYGRGDW